MRNNVNMQQSALLFAMNFVSQNKERFLQNFYLKGKRSVAKATNEGPAAYVIPADNPRPVEVADAVNLLRLMGVEVHAAKNDFTVRDQKYGAGSYVVRMDQPYRNAAIAFLEKQNFPEDEPNQPYDDVAWTWPLLFGVEGRAYYLNGRLSWWCRPPEGWEALAEWFDDTIETLDSLLPESTARMSERR